MDTVSSVSVDVAPLDGKHSKSSSAVTERKDTSINIDGQVSSSRSTEPTTSPAMPQPKTEDESTSIFTDMKHLFIACLLIWRAVIRALIPSFIYSREKNVAGSTVVITGGAFGLGRLMSRKLAARGAQVVILDINRDHMAETVKLINESSDQSDSLSGKAYSYYCDVSDREAVYALAKQIESEIAPVDILIMNAGVVNGGPLLSLKDESIIRLFNINALSHFWLLKAFLPSMMNRNSGHVVSIDSVASYYGTAELSDYCASKAASHKLLESIDFELRYSGYDGVKTTSVMPYFMNTGMFAGSYSKYFKILEPEVVADAAVRAILTNQTVIFVPWSFQCLRALTYCVPFDAYSHVQKALFGGTMMKKFTGRPPAPVSPTHSDEKVTSTTLLSDNDDEFSNSILDSLKNNLNNNDKLITT